MRDGTSSANGPRSAGPRDPRWATIAVATRCRTGGCIRSNGTGTPRSSRSGLRASTRTAPGSEIETLFQAQWDDGFVPHIVFWRDDAGYFPGPAVWATGRTPPTSGITQPPVAATVVRELWTRASDSERRCGRVCSSCFDKLLALASLVRARARSARQGIGRRGASVGDGPRQLAGVGRAVAHDRCVGRRRVSAPRHDASRPEHAADQGRVRPLSGVGAVRSRHRLGSASHRTDESLPRRRRRHDDDPAARQSRSARARAGARAHGRGEGARGSTSPRAEAGIDYLWDDAARSVIARAM